MQSHTHTDGEDWVPSKTIAEEAGLVADYVSRLARQRTIKGKKIDGVWYVERRAFVTYLEEKEALKRTRAEELARARRAEYQSHQETQAVPEVQTPVTFSLTPVLSVAAVLLVLLGTFTFGGASLGPTVPVEPASNKASNGQTANAFTAIGKTIENLSRATYDAVFGTPRAETVTDAHTQTPLPTLATSTEENTELRIASYTPTFNPLLGTYSATTTALRLLRINAGLYVRDNITTEGDVSAWGSIAAGGAGTFQGAVTTPRLNTTVVNTNTLTATGDATVEGELIAEGGIITNNADIQAGDGSVYASNLIYSLAEGRNITIDWSDPHRPVISARSSGRWQRQRHRCNEYHRHHRLLCSRRKHGHWHLIDHTRPSDWLCAYRKRSKYHRPLHPRWPLPRCTHRLFRRKSVTPLRRIDRQVLVWYGWGRKRRSCYLRRRCAYP